jgi:hypothetical protein
MACLKVHWNYSVVFLNLRCLFPLFNIHFHRSGVSNLHVKFPLFKIFHTPSQETLMGVSPYCPCTHLETLRKTVIPLSLDSL